VPELRTDWLTERTVIVAEERAGRPNEFGGGIVPRRVADTGLRERNSADAFQCPFCPGHEHRTPPAVYEQLGADGCWRVRVVPNMYPALMLPGAGLPAVEAASPGVEPALGAHEVIIEAARHVDRTGLVSVDELRNVLEVYSARLRHWRDDGRYCYGLVFKNEGPRAGASLSHLHSQLVALPAVPSNVGREMRRAEHDFAKQRSCPYCRVIQQERSAGVRIVADRDGFVAFCPFASWQPWEVWLMPAQHQPAFERQSQPAGLDRLADVLHELVARVESIVPETSYNLLLRTAPWIDGVNPWYHWRIELLPRVVEFAGLELAAGIHINPLSPEHAAQQLRS
jgi:UDPglucose--hexose-1-phosphate uridylyltransferase